MGFEAGAESRPTVPVRRDIAALAVEVFVACQRASFEQYMPHRKKPV